MSDDHDLLVRLDERVDGLKEWFQGLFEMSEQRRREQYEEYERLHAEQMRSHTDSQEQLENKLFGQPHGFVHKHEVALFGPHGLHERMGKIERMKTWDRGWITGWASAIAFLTTAAALLGKYGYELLTAIKRH